MSKTAGSKAVLMIAYTHYETDPRVIREAEAALNAGFEVDFLALRRPQNQPVEEIRGVRVIRVNQHRYRGGGHIQYLLAYLQFFLRCFFKSTSLFLRRRYKIIHVNNIPDFLVFSAIIPKLLGARIILDIHDPMPNTFASKYRSGDNGFFFKLLLVQERLSAAFADCVLTVSDPVREAILVAQHGIPGEKVRVVANFADDQLFNLRKCAEINGKIRMIFHGTILERYGLRDLMQALSRVKRKERLAVRIIGEGDFSTQLKELIRELGLQDAVQFENRLYPLHSIPDIVSSANLGLVPLKISSITNYALPLKLLEYISLGLPVVTVRSAAISYYLNEEDCFFYQPGKIESLVSILDQVTEDPSCLYPFRERTVKLREKFLWSGEGKKYSELLRELSGPARN